MINNEERFFSYLKGIMNSEELEKFENDLSKSADLKNEFNEYKKLNNIISEVKSIHLNSEYSNSIITNFRNRIKLKNTKSAFPKIRYAFAALFIVVAGYFVISTFTKENPQNIKSLLAGYSEAELNSFNDNFYSSNIENNFNDYDSNKLDSIYSENIFVGIIGSINEKQLDDILNINNVSDVNDYVTDNDVDKIYSQLIDKEIL
ncbi:MAG: hypothetical protein ABI638_02810 [Ignavibacteriota bacterium]